MGCDTFVMILARGIDYEAFTMDFCSAMYGEDTSRRDKKFTEWKKEHTQEDYVWSDYLRELPIEDLLALSKQYPKLKIVTYEDTTPEYRGKASFYGGKMFDVLEVVYPEGPIEDDFDEEEEFENALDEQYNFEAPELEDWDNWSKFDIYCDQK